MADTADCANPNTELIAVEIGLTDPVRCALICSSASAAARMMMLIRAKSLRSSR
jgi:hypothetical protein